MHSLISRQPHMKLTSYSPLLSESVLQAGHVKFSILVNNNIFHINNNDCQEDNHSQGCKSTARCMHASFADCAAQGRRDFSSQVNAYILQVDVCVMSV
jgi:hypothetical protein